MAAWIDGASSFNRSAQLEAWREYIALHNGGRLPVPDLVEQSNMPLRPD
jgi:nitrogen fixation protein